MKNSGSAIDSRKIPLRENSLDISSLLGWAGTVLIVGAYWLNSTNHIASTSRAYQLMNLFGAIGMLVNVLHTETWAAVVLQLIWGSIALTSILRNRSNK